MISKNLLAMCFINGIEDAVTKQAADAAVDALHLE